AVKMLIGNNIDFPIVEITGSFGKTTSIKCAISLLRRKFSILCLISNEILFIDRNNESILLNNNSTTPANIIKAIELCPRIPDIAIFEVSLGGTGLADLGIIKNVYDNYPIAKGTSSALEAKLSMIRNKKPEGKILLNADDPLLRNISIKNCQYFSTNSICEIYAKDITVTSNMIKFIAKFNGFITINGPLYSEVLVEAINKPIGRQHIENIIVGISIAKFFDNIEEKIEIPNHVFDDKMIIEDPDYPIILNKSPAINEKVVERSIRDYLELFPPIRLEIGGKLKTTCGFINIEKLAQIINNSPFEEVFLFDEIGNAIRPLVKKKIVDHNRRKLPILRIERS
ncbi:MAG: Mur ligase family protein, partial [Candidatus Methanomethylicia archaeon]|nr:Mur ligase family protein [Candidatus Methanomethylicia archaeon]